jgi:hypothetical protein
VRFSFVIGFNVYVIGFNVYYDKCQNGLDVRLTPCAFTLFFVIMPTNNVIDTTASYRFWFGIGIGSNTYEIRMFIPLIVWLRAANRAATKAWRLR